jgi:His-Xaa-Ser system protein HxsD
LGHRSPLSELRVQVGAQTGGFDLSDAVETTEELEELIYASDGRRVSFVLDEELYPRDAVYGAAYLFVDRCFIFLTRPKDATIEVRLKPKEEGDAKALEALAGEFANELLNQVIRARVGEATAQIREYYMAKAFFADSNQTSIDALLAELDAEELEEDPLEISVPWEEPNE